MPNDAVQPPANTGVVGARLVRTFSLTESSGPYAGQTVQQEATVQADPTTGLGAAVTLIHTTVKSAIPTGGSTLASGVSQLQDIDGNVDPAFEAGVDQKTPVGLATGTANLKQIFYGVYCAQNLAASSTPVVMTLAGPFPAALKVNCVATIDAGATQETHVITAVNAGSNQITVSKLTNPHNGTVTPFPVVLAVYNEEVDTSGELDLTTGQGAASAVGYGYDGLTHTRDRQVFGLGRFTTTTTGALTASTVNVAIPLTAAPPANLPNGSPLLIIDGANSELCKISGSSVGGKTITVVSVANAHNSGVNVIAAVQSLNTAPVNFAAFGIDAEGAVVFSGLSAAGDPLLSLERDANSIAAVSATLNPAVNSANSAGMDADVEFGVCFTAAQTYANNTHVCDQHGQGGEDLVTVGGRLNFPITQANVQGGATVMKATAGRLCRLLVTTVTGGASLIITDGVAGTVLGVIPSGAAVGTIYDLQMPAATSINIPQAAAWTGAITASYY